MPTFMILCRDGAGKGALRAETRPRHLDHLAQLEGRIVCAGPFLDEAGAPVGSLILAEFEELGAAQAFAKADPYSAAGVFEEVIVAAWRQTLP